MKPGSVLMTAVVFLTAGASVASAELVQGISIDFVTIGNPGNPGDTRTDCPDCAKPYGCGSVDYVYKIGKYEISNAQWYDFVSAAGAPTGDLSEAYDEPAYWTGDNIPANYVSWYEAAQFCNYLTSGDKSRGAYQFSGDNSNPGWFERIDRDSAVSTYGIVYVIPTEDEWYKAAYYSGSGYSTYADGTDTVPIVGVDTNYEQDPPYAGPWDVGKGTQEQNGTFDMMGNVWEWNETIQAPYFRRRGARGGSFDYFYRSIGSAYDLESIPYNESSNLGFRVASIPEPGTLLLLGLGALSLVRRGERR